MSFRIRLPSPVAVLLIHEQHGPDGAPRPQVQLVEQPERFHGDGHSGAVVDGSGPQVPRVQVASNDHHFLRTRSPANLRQDVGRLRIRQELTGQGHPDAHLLS